jgi:uncharacterized membrane protein
MQVYGISFMRPYKQSGRWQDVLDQVFCWFLLRVHRFLCHLLPPYSGQKNEASQECNTRVRVIRDQGVKRNYGLQEWGSYSGLQKIRKTY